MTFLHGVGAGSKASGDSTASIQSFSSLQCSGKFPSMSSLRHLWQDRTAGLKYFFTSACHTLRDEDTSFASSTKLLSAFRGSWCLLLASQSNLSPAARQQRSTSQRRLLSLASSAFSIPRRRREKVSSASESCLLQQSAMKSDCSPSTWAVSKIKASGKTILALKKPSCSELPGR